MQGYDMVGQVEVVFGIQERGEVVRVVREAKCMVLAGDSFRKVWDRQD